MMWGACVRAWHCVAMSGTRSHCASVGAGCHASIGSGDGTACAVSFILKNKRQARAARLGKVGVSGVVGVHHPSTGRAHLPAAIFARGYAHQNPPIRKL